MENKHAGYNSEYLQTEENMANHSKFQPLFDSAWLQFTRLHTVLKIISDFTLITVLSLLKLLYTHSFNSLTLTTQFKILQKQKLNLFLLTLYADSQHVIADKTDVGSPETRAQTFFSLARTLFSLYLCQSHGIVDYLSADYYAARNSPFKTKS